MHGEQLLDAAAHHALPRWSSCRSPRRKHAQGYKCPSMCISKTQQPIRFAPLHTYYTTLSHPHQSHHHSSPSSPSSISITISIGITTTITLLPFSFILGQAKDDPAEGEAQQQLPITINKHPCSFQLVAPRALQPTKTIAHRVLQNQNYHCHNVLNLVSQHHIIRPHPPHFLFLWIISARGWGTISPLLHNNNKTYIHTFITGTQHHNNTTHAARAHTDTHRHTHTP
ncbi:hypothetical protein B0O80DRAFT_289911 [Mortierella sp. GBAus27b]|nr:hypothetical protein B0O80DRAFT_289911 [Mortierella sp. GBAus27b]